VGPYIVLDLDAVDDVLDGCHGGEHGVILVVVLVHAIATYQEEVLKTVGVVADDVETVVTAEVCRVSLGNVDDVGVFHVLYLEDAYPGDFPDGEFCHLFIGKFPQLIGFVAEVFQADPNLVLKVYQPTTTSGSGYKSSYL
jgi:hypothetical protein